MADRQQSLCDHCGHADDHPKVQVGGTAGLVAAYHHDCLPAQVRAQVVSDPKGAAIVEAAEGGKRGQELLDLILSLHQKA